MAKKKFDMFAEGFEMYKQERSEELSSATASTEAAATIQPNAQHVQEVQYVQEVQERQSVQAAHEPKKEAPQKKVVNKKEAESTPLNVKKTIGSTRGKKGHKLSRINMAFSDDNHEYITFASRYEGLSVTAFVNQILDEYRKKHPINR